jgi:DNA-binding NarL/FixJ family response regulator
MVDSCATREPPHRLLLHEPDSLDAELLAGELEKLEDIEIIGSAETTEAAINLVRSREPNLVVSDANAPGDQTLRLARKLRARPTAPRLLVFGVDDDPGLTLEYLEAGADSVLSRETALADLRLSVRYLLAGRTFLDPTLVNRAVRRLAELAEVCESTRIDGSRLERLTPRENEVLELLGEDLTNAAIADRLDVKISTVKSHVHSVLDKLEVPTRDRAARYLQLTRDVAS